MKRWVSRLLGMSTDENTDRTSAPKRKSNRNHATRPCGASENARYFVRTEKYPGEGWWRQFIRTVSHHWRRSRRRSWSA